MDEYLLNKLWMNNATKSDSHQQLSILNRINPATQSASSTTFLTERNQCLDRSLNQCIEQSRVLQERYPYIYKKLDEAARLRFRSRMQEMLSIVKMHQGISVKDIVFDTYSESSMIVSFEERTDIKLTINLDEPDCFYSEDSSQIENVEVAYLTYKSNGQRHTINNTLQNIINQLVEMYA